MEFFWITVLILIGIGMSTKRFHDWLMQAIDDFEHGTFN